MLYNIHIIIYGPFPINFMLTILIKLTKISSKNGKKNLSQKIRIALKHMKKHFFRFMRLSVICDMIDFVLKIH